MIKDKLEDWQQGDSPLAENYLWMMHDELLKFLRDSTLDPERYKQKEAEINELSTFDEYNKIKDYLLAHRQTIREGRTLSQRELKKELPE